MINTLLSSPISFVLLSVGLVLAITIHEFAHAFTADHLGDPTPRHQGRVSLNPLVHLDPLGTLMLLIARFGWGKPVQFDPFNLRSPRRDTAIISVAGPASNLVLAAILSLIGKLLLPPTLFPLLIPLIFINISLAIFNLVPVYPLDGAKILTGLLPQNLALEWESVTRRYGTLILILLIFPFFGTSPISTLIFPVINWISSLLI